MSSADNPGYQQVKPAPELHGEWHRASLELMWAIPHMTDGELKTLIYEARQVLGAAVVTLSKRGVADV